MKKYIKHINKIFYKEKTTFTFIYFSIKYLALKRKFSLFVDTSFRFLHENTRSTGAIIYLVEVHVSSRLSRNIPSVSLLHCPRTHTVHTHTHTHITQARKRVHLSISYFSLQFSLLVYLEITSLGRSHMGVSSGHCQMRGWWQ